jgi:carbonic anhydrase/acetyltransferase-like protein (isoleucine patch superfamily)
LVPVGTDPDAKVEKQPDVIHETTFIAPGAVVSGDVTIGANSSVWYNAVLRGDMEPVTVGESTNIQDLAVVHVDEDFPCSIGSRVGVGHGAIIHGCTIEDDSLIGMGAILMNGVHVGTGSLIGAGAVLTEGIVIPPGSLVVGVPARVVRRVDDELMARIRDNSKHYAVMAADHRAGRYPLTGPSSTSSM